MGAEEGAGQVYGDDLLPKVERKFVEGMFVLEARVVDQDVELAEGVDGFLDELVYLAGV